MAIQALSFRFLCGTQCILEQKVSTKSWMAAISLSPLCEILLLFGTKFQYSCKRRQDEEGKQSCKAAIRDWMLTFCPTMHSVQQKKTWLETLDACIVFKDRFN